MTLSEYFGKKKGKGVIATCDSSGKVGIAYLFIEDGNR